MKISLSNEQFDQTDNSARLDALRLPHVQLEKVYLNEQRLSGDDFKVTGERIILSRHQLVSDDNLHVYLEIGTKRILTERYVAIIVALIGLTGTIVGGLLQTPWLSDLFESASSVIIFEPDHYGVRRSEKKFISTMRWEQPGEQNYSFSTDLPKTHVGYAFLRVRTTNDNLRGATMKGLTGPVPLRNGTNWEVSIEEELYQAYLNRNAWLQLVVFAVPRGMRPAEGQRLSDLGSSAKVLMAPSVRSRP